MPIYEFRCDSCAKRFDVLHTSRSEAAICPQCQRPMVKLFSVPAALVTKPEREPTSCSTGSCCTSCGD